MLFLVNLDSAIQRRTAMAARLSRLNCTYRRIGVDLRKVSDAEVEHRIASLFPGLSFDRKRLSNAEIGCWLSHLCAWRELVAAQAEPSATIIEDDLHLAPQFADAIRAIAVREQFDVIYLGTSSRNVSQRRRTMIGGFAVHEAVGVIFNTWGYSISRDYAQRFLGAGSLHIKLPIDHVLGGKGGAMGPRIGVLQPAVVEEDEVLGAASQIGPHTRRIDRSRIVQEARRRMLASPLGTLYHSLYRYL